MQGSIQFSHKRVNSLLVNIGMALNTTGYFQDNIDNVSRSKKKGIDKDYGHIPNTFLLKLWPTIEDTVPKTDISQVMPVQLATN
jgi:hypothetical protein